MNQNLPQPYKRSGVNVEFKLDLFNYAAKSDLTGATGINTSAMESKQDLVSLKTEIDNLDVDKLDCV